MIKIKELEITDTLSTWRPFAIRRTRESPGESVVSDEVSGRTAERHLVAVRFRRWIRDLEPLGHGQISAVDR